MTDTVIFALDMHKALRMHTLQSEMHLQPTYGMLKKKRKKEQPIKLVSECFLLFFRLCLSVDSI